MNPYITLVAGWVVYFALHSVLAIEGIKAKFPRRAYRIFYVVFSTAGLLALMFYNGSIPALKFFVSEGPARWASLILTIFGVMVIQTSFRQYNLQAFLGFKTENNELQTHGILEYVRHPIQAGIILVVLGFFFFIPNMPTLISCACILIYIPIGMHLEEKKLIKTYGDKYAEYKKRVPAIIPDKLVKELS
jgi:protein-S-isoprenylcysteine O-methyltransferase Ste14